MSFINKFLSSKAVPKFVTDEKYRSNLANMLKVTPQTLAQLREHNISDESTLKLEYFFYSNNEDNAIKLVNRLKSEGYSVEFGPSAGDRKLLVVTGWTIPMKMDEANILKWTEDMCNIGYEFDCDFDGWGTNLQQ